MSWSSGWYSSLSNRYMYEGACPPLESNVLLQKKARTMKKYMAEQWCYVMNQSYTGYPVSKLRKKHKWKRTYMLEMNNMMSSGGT